MFKVGDIIRGKANNGYNITNGEMLKAEVVNAEAVSGIMTIVITKHKHVDCVNLKYKVKNSNDCFELVKRKEIKLSDLKNGMVVEYRNGSKRFYKDNSLYDNNGYLQKYSVSNDYDKNLTDKFNPEHDIVKIYEDFKGLANNGLIWERKEIDWSKVEVDTPLMVKFSSLDNDEDIPRHFAKYEHGKIYVWSDGRTSHTAQYKSDMDSVYSAKLI